MPELPEVETVRRSLEKKLTGAVLKAPVVLYAPSFLSRKEDVSRAFPGAVLSIGRRGKYLLLALSTGYTLLFHLRMEGKLFVEEKEPEEKRHLSLYLPFKGREGGLYFFDTRRFGRLVLLREGEEGPLCRVGKEPSEIEDAEEMHRLLHGQRRPLKEVIMDQSVIAGIGNIYADETLFAARLSPFRPASSLSLAECGRLLKESQRILRQAIEAHGSTVRTFQSDENHAGDYQEHLLVYGREGKECLVCKKAKIGYRKLSGRGTHFCPVCQHTGITLAVTGKIGSGKSLVCSYFEKLGYVRFSSDEAVHQLYSDERFLNRLKTKFPFLFTPELDKGRITLLLSSDPSFRRQYEAVLFREVRALAERFLNRNDGKDKVLEVPLLFESHMDKLADVKIGVETTKQRKHLKERGDQDIDTRLKFNDLNHYDRHRHEMDYILTTDSTKKALKEEVLQVHWDLQRRFYPD